MGIPNRRPPPRTGLVASLHTKASISKSKTLSALLVAQLRSHLPIDSLIVTEHRFHPTRHWRFDVALPDSKLAVEIEGGTWIGGRHTTGAGFASDAEKYGAAMLAGWRVLRVPTIWVSRGRAAAHIVALLDPNAPRPLPATPPRRRTGERKRNASIVADHAGAG